MKKAITEELKANCLQVNNYTLTKIIQLYETKSSRHSVMIVGNTQSGKTVCWRMLQASMTRLNKEGAAYQAVKVSFIFFLDWKLISFIIWLTRLLVPSLKKVKEQFVNEEIKKRRVSPIIEIWSVL